MFALCACATSIDSRTARRIGCSAIKEAYSVGPIDCAALSVERVRKGWGVSLDLPIKPVIGGGPAYVIVSRDGRRTTPTINQ